MWTSPLRAYPVSGRAIGVPRAGMGLTARTISTAVNRPREQPEARLGCPRDIGGCRAWADCGGGHALADHAVVHRAGAGAWRAARAHRALVLPRRFRRN